MYIQALSRIIRRTVFLRNLNRKECRKFKCLLPFADDVAERIKAFSKPYPERATSKENRCVHSGEVVLIRPWRSKHSITCLGKKQFRVSSNALYLTDRLPHHHFRCHLLANNAMAAIAAKTAPARN